MANASDNQACSFFATIFAQLLARVLSEAQGSAWQVGLAEPPSATIPALEAPVHYCLRFGERLKGCCYAAFGQADIAIFGGRDQATAKDADMVADAESLREVPATAMLELMRKLAGTMPEAMASSHGLVTTTVEQVSAVDPLSVYALELQAKGPERKLAVVLLHFDPAMLESLAGAGLNQPVPPRVDTSLVQANLGLVMDVELSCTLRFGQRQLTLREILDLASGSVVELDRQVDEPVELILDGRVIARGEAVIIDGNYGLRVTQVLHAIAY